MAFSTDPKVRTTRIKRMIQELFQDFNLKASVNLNPKSQKKRTKKLEYTQRAQFRFSMGNVSDMIPQKAPNCNTNLRPPLFCFVLFFYIKE